MGAKGLGRGFDTLLPQGFDKDLLAGGERIVQVKLQQITANIDQPRKHFDELAIESLAQSIRQYGILQPLVVTKKGQSYEIIAGERRFRAAGIAGLESVPVIVRSVKELEQLEIALVENMQRVDLSLLEQAATIDHLHQQFSMSYESIGKRLGRATSTVVNIVRLLQLPEPARVALNARQIVEGHARQILALKDMPDKQDELLAAIMKHNWTVRQAEQFVTSIKEGHVRITATQARMKKETPETKQLGNRLGASVLLRRSAKGGKIEISFKNDEQLARIFQKLG
ncbi:MAG: ParB/RepB/Spo0J family partition protein [Candidatus Saccharimonadales bacterium]